jgi:predicted lysophospholipase L1 biosynthesis ABC-type transport system permease subunit
MTDRLLGLMALAIGGALAWFLFEPVMSATAAHGVNTDTLLTVVVLLLGVLVGWEVVERLRRYGCGARKEPASYTPQPTPRRGYPGL